MPKEEIAPKVIDLSKTNEDISQQKNIPTKPSTINQAPPTPTNQVKQNTQTKTINKKNIKYKYVRKENLIQLIKETIPKQLIPTARLGSIMGMIFLAVVVLALLEFPIDRLISGDTNIVTAIGYPWHFLELKMMNPEENPLLAENLIKDLLLYILISYIIDVCINFILDIDILKSKEEGKKKPKAYRKLNPTIADKITKKVFNK